MDFVKNLRIESYSKNYLKFQDAFVETERTDRLIAKEAAKTKEQAATAKELTLELEIAK